MKRNRPASVLVIAILHLIGGGLGLIVSICAGIGLVMAGAIFSGAPPGGPAGQDPNVQMIYYLKTALPSYMAIAIADTLFALVLAMMLLSGGIGLLMMQAWARYLSLVYAMLSILRKLFMVAYCIFFLWPAQDAFYKQLQGPNAATFVQTQRLSNIGGQIANTCFIIYPITVLIIMLLPSVAAAFAGRTSPRGEERDEEEEGWGGSAARERWSDRDREDRPPEDRDTEDRGRGPRDKDEDERDRDRYSDRR